MKYSKEQFQTAIYNTIENIDLWKTVLKLLCDITGAHKAIITLRDPLSAEVVVPLDVREILQSPLLYGLTDQEIETYIEYYIQHDCWTEIEKLYHPNKPYALSKFLPIETLKESEFWNWLEPQGFDDSVVVDIGSSHPNWVAMNLYFRNEEQEVKAKLLQITADLQSTMQHAWHLAQKQRIKPFDENSLLYLLNKQPSPSFAIQADRTILYGNDKGKKLLTSNSGVFKGLKNDLRIKDKDLNNKLVTEIQKVVQSPISTQKQSDISISNDNLKLTLGLMPDRPQTILGESKALLLLSIKELTDGLSDKLVWDSEKLTTRERQLVEMLANNKRIVDFYKHYGISKPRGHQIWKRVREKLDINHKSDIIVAHQKYLDNL